MQRRMSKLISSTDDLTPENIERLKEELVFKQSLLQKDGKTVFELVKMKKEDHPDKILFIFELRST